MREYFLAIGAYHVALGQNNPFAADANLIHVLAAHDKVKINGFYGVNSAVDTAFQMGRLVGR